MKQITAIVVEDNALALEMLTNDLKRNYQEIHIIGTATSVVTAAKLLRNTVPNLLFLDIMLGDGTGFDILEIFPELNSKIIFVTASDAYAIKAFKFAAIDYILKPYTTADLELAIQKATQQLQPEKEQLNVLRAAIANPNALKKISLHTAEKILIVNLKDIIRCKSDNNYTTFYLTSKKTILVSKTLKYYADLLAEAGFLRVHQSHLINTSYIKEFVKTDGGYLVLQDSSRIPVSVRKRNVVLENLKTL